MPIASGHRTKIVCTLGPATEQRERVRALLRLGVDVFRLNAAHGTPAAHRRRIRTVREEAARLGAAAGLLMDIPGPKYRLGELPGGSVELKDGEEVWLGSSGSARALPLSHPSLLRDLRRGEKVFLADGTVRLVVQSVHIDRARCRVEFGGRLRSRSGINLPETRLSVRLPTPEDRRWIALAGRERIDWIGISFVRSASDVEAVRRALTGAWRPFLMAKIEKRQALEALPAILAAADGVMVARGDLGVETPLPEVPLAQKRIIAEAMAAGKPVITATQMLESMVERSSPTRAEVADVANAILDGTDAVMLSAETTIGRYPLEAVRLLGDVASAVERTYPYRAVRERLAGQRWTAGLDAMSLVACRLADDLEAAAILIPAEIGAAAFRVARFRPRAPVYLLGQPGESLGRYALGWNIHPVKLGTRRLDAGTVRSFLLRSRLARRGQSAVFVSACLPGAACYQEAVQVLHL